MVYLLGCLPPSGCHTGALVRALGPHGKLVPLRNADLCSTAALRPIRPKSKQPNRFYFVCTKRGWQSFPIRLPRGGCHRGALVRALGRHGKLVPLRNADLCSTAALRLIRPTVSRNNRSG